MPQFTQAFKVRMVKRMTGPKAMSAKALARTVAVSQESLSRWLREAQNTPVVQQRQRVSTPYLRRIRQLERELRLKEKALADTVALLVRKNKVHLLDDGV